jgi:hypothetical protein
MSDKAIVLLRQGAGYSVTIGLGLVFGIGMILVSRFWSKYMNERSDHSEMSVSALYDICYRRNTDEVTRIGSWLPIVQLGRI